MHTHTIFSCSIRLPAFVTALGQLGECLSSPFCRFLLFSSFVCQVGRSRSSRMERRSPAPSPAPSPPASFSAGVSYSVGSSFMSSYERSPHYNFANPGRSVLRAYLLRVCVRACASNAHVEKPQQTQPAAAPKAHGPVIKVRACTKPSDIFRSLASFLPTPSFSRRFLFRRVRWTRSLCVCSLTMIPLSPWKSCCSIAQAS